LPAAKDPVGQAVTAKGKPTSVVTPLSMPATASVQPSMVSRNDLAKGYEFEKGKYVCVSQNELAQLLPPTAGEIDIREFVSAAEIEPVFMDSTYLVVPDRVGQRAYALLLEALCRSGLAGLAQVAMHSRESVVVLDRAETASLRKRCFMRPRSVASGSIAPTGPWLRPRKSR
jgi:DNA end-binding protein Ku